MRREKMKMKKYEQLSAKGSSGSDLTDRGRVVGAVMEVPGALGKDSRDSVCGGHPRLQKASLLARTSRTCVGHHPDSKSLLLGGNAIKYRT